MYTEAELAETVAALQNPNPPERAAMLKALWAWPSQDDRLLPYLRGLLNDTAPCIFGSPMRFGEIRWLAAQVIFAEFKARQRKESVWLEDAVRPLNGDELTALAASAGIDCDSSLPSLLAAFTELHRQNQLPTTTLELRL
ncbi:MAG: hypothetical protein KF753_24355 [Caldilineaceae bacterium]|nr:hypothetical protein [Caldilineaceae bacterium]